MKYLLTAFLLIIWISGLAQEIDLLKLDRGLENVNTAFSREDYKGKESLKVIPADVQSEAKFVKLTSNNFSNGIIEVDVAGKRKEGAGAGARGFVGLAFRINEDNSAFECFYIRPTNGRAEDQLRRNHSVQYISFPEFPWHKLRRETPGKYETYADMEEGAWTHLKIEVSGDKARLYVHGAEQPTLLVNDLKLGSDKAGKLGLWVGPGTEAYFANLMIKHK